MSGPEELAKRLKTGKEAALSGFPPVTLGRSYPSDQRKRLYLELLGDNRARRAVTSTTSQKELGVLLLKAPKSNRPQTMPFSLEEVNRILEGCDRIENPNPLIERAAQFPIYS